MQEQRQGGGGGIYMQELWFLCMTHCLKVLYDSMNRHDSMNRSKIEFIAYILSVNEKLPVSNFQYFRKYIIQLFGYCYVHVSSQCQAGLER